MCLWHTHRRDSGSVCPKCSQGSRKDGQNHFGHGGNSFADVNAVEVPNQPFFKKNRYFPFNFVKH